MKIQASNIHISMMNDWFTDDASFIMPPFYSLISCSTAITMISNSPWSKAKFRRFIHTHLMLSHCKYETPKQRQWAAVAAARVTAAMYNLNYPLVYKATRRNAYNENSYYIGFLLRWRQKEHNSIGLCEVRLLIEWFTVGIMRPNSTWPFPRKTVTVGRENKV